MSKCRQLLISIITTMALFITITGYSAELNISDTPLTVTQSAPPLTLLVMDKSHKLYYEAYNDASDLDNDGILEIRYKPTINYLGLFDSYKCYTYNNGIFNPSSVTTDKRCSGAFSGDFLNYLTTTRMDALRVVLYGGLRSTDSTTQTILERAYIPQDAHSFGKEYSSVAVDGYDISDYTPFSKPTAGFKHLFASTTPLNGDQAPLLRVLLNEDHDINEWVSIERPVANTRVEHGGSGPQVTPTDYIVRVEVCNDSIGLEANCRTYPSGAHKPIGLLQQFGENDSMRFGLLTGSFANNLSGGVLRKNVEEFNNEIDSNTGQFTSNANIINTINNLRIPNFQGNYEHQSNCGFIFNRQFNEGECRSWGNPIAEMMYEGLRYFAGTQTPTAAFTYSGGDDDTLNLPDASNSWNDPYHEDNNPYCAKPNMLVISDVNPSYDSDQVPGSSFGSMSSDITPAVNVSSLADIIWGNEYSAAKDIFMGEVGNTADGAPTVKTATAFSNIRGFPEEPNKQGSYYAASVAYHGWLNDISSAEDDQKVNTYAIALSSPIPKIDIDVNGQTVSIYPFAKSVGGCGGIDNTAGAFQPTDNIVDFYVESLGTNSGTFSINFEDVEQGADHDMDAIATYSYSVSGGAVTIDVNSQYAAGCIIQHIGYVISGTTEDGTYLVVRDSDTSAGSDVDYFLDTPPGEGPNGNWDDDTELPLSSSRTFTPSSTLSATVLPSPLYFAAKYGSFTDKNNNNLPDQTVEWDADGNGVPDNYFPVTNAGELSGQLASALNNILDRSSSASSGTTNSSILTSDTKYYQALFNSSNWSGQLLAFAVDSSSGEILTDGSGPNGSLWDAGSVLSQQNYDNGRVILTYKPSKDKGIAFRWPSNPDSPSNSELDTSQITALNANPDNGNISDGNGQARLNYLRGDDSNEGEAAGNYRERTTLLGDIVNSSPIYIGPPAFAYNDNWGSGAPENNVTYSSYKTSKANRTPIIVAGANDGMLHAFDAETGAEEWAYIPSPVYDNLNLLTSQNYDHRFYVDAPVSFGDVFWTHKSVWKTILVAGLGKGGQGIYAINITNPTTFTESTTGRVQWEFTDEDDADLGYTYSQPTIARSHVTHTYGHWVVVFGNGYNNTANVGSADSTTGNAVLYVVDARKGSLIKKIDTGVGMSADPSGLNRPNGLASPAVVDIDGDFTADYVYAGDLFGNVWKFDISSTDASAWSIANNGSPIFVATSADGTTQAITSQVIVGSAKTMSGALQLYFGTGKYLETNDKINAGLNTQSFYGIIDDSNGSILRSELLQQSIIAETTGYRISTDYQLSAGQRGWYMDFDFTEGERVVSDPILRDGRIIFSTLIPSDNVCAFGGTSWLMELDAAHGSRLSFSPFDVDGDQDFTEDDFLTYTIPNTTDTETVPVSGKKSDVGIITTPKTAIVVNYNNNSNFEAKIISGSSGDNQTVTESPGAPAARQSWRQVK